jgi:REP-associated tyrosine transposase
MRAIESALREARARFGVRIVHFSVQGNHLHLILEADSAENLARAMQGLAIRLARGLNSAAGRSGRAFADRHHAHVLSTRREVSNAVRYLLENFRNHLRADLAPQGADPCSSARWLVLALDDYPQDMNANPWLFLTLEES